MEKLITEFGVLLGGVLVGLVIAFINFIKKIYDKKIRYKKSSIKYQFKEFSEINEKLAELRILTSAKRISIYQFHNGEYYTSNNSVLKASMTYENCSATSKSWINESQGLQASTFFTPLKKVIEEREKYIVFDNTQIANSSLKQLSHYRGDKTSIFSPLYNKANEIIGLLQIDYSDITIPESKLKECVIDYADIISYILSR